MATVRSLGRAVAEAAMVTSLGRKEWEVLKKDMDLNKAGPVHDHDM